jgi:glycosyltransferase involved in cell wall biosynthesis
VLALPNGCRPPRPVPGGRAAARDRCGEGDGPLIVHLGVMQRADADLLFEAFRLLRRGVPAARLMLLGSFRGAVPADLQAMVGRTGYLSDDALSDWLAAADAAIVPLRPTLANRARWPGKVNEYMSAGVPVVMPAVGAAADWVAGAGAGVVCAPTAVAFAEALAGVLQRPDARAEMGGAGQALAAGELSWRRLGSELLDFYERWVPQSSAALVKGAGKAAW